MRNLVNVSEIKNLDSVKGGTCYVRPVYCAPVPTYCAPKPIVISFSWSLSVCGVFTMPAMPTMPVPTPPRDPANMGGGKPA